MTRPNKWQVRLIQLLAIPGLLVSFYLWLYHNGHLMAICSASGWDDCGLVSGPTARYSAIGPFPVAMIGFIGYATIFLLTWLPAWVLKLEQYLPELLLGVVGMGLLFTVGLTALEIFVIHAVCRYCLISAAIIGLMFILSVSFIRAASRQTEELPDRETGTRKRLDVA